jgi:apolipoprotein N-acyltransferase
VSAATPLQRIIAAPWPQRATALLAGAGLTCAFAPYSCWWFALLSPALLIGLWSRAPRARDGAWLGFAFGLGTYATGTWWLYISIHVLGQAPVWVALLVMAALVLIMSGYQAALGYVVVRWLPCRCARGWLVAIPAAWVVLEWFRGWFLSGFPWLSLGYSQTDSWLVGLAPVGGVHLISLALLVGAGALVTLLQSARAPLWSAQRLVALVALILPWTLALQLRGVEWTKSAGAPTSVAILQGAVPQDMKWLVSNQRTILDDYARLHAEALGARLIVWPESALPDLANLFPEYISSVWSSGQRSGSDVLMGVMRLGDDKVNYYNSVLALGPGEPAFYDKRHLVPFGEYFPVPAWVRNWLRLMSLPYSDFTPGAEDQPPLQLAGLKVAANICYEDAYPGILRRATRQASLIVTVTNDAWFGRSGARYQHFQIARLRAAESRRYLLRAANDGVSAIVDPSGAVVARAPEFTPAVLRGRIEPRAGNTPFLITGNSPVIGAAATVLSIMIAVPLWRRRKGPRQGIDPVTRRNHLHA